MFHCINSRLNPVIKPQFLKHALQMDLHCAFRYSQFSGNFLLLKPSANWARMPRSLGVSFSADDGRSD
jgi:hypothetical protein